MTEQTPRAPRTSRAARRAWAAWAVVRVLRDRNAGLYLGGVVVSGFGSSAMWLVAGIWVKDLTGSDGLAALCVFALWAPTLIGPALGTLADRTRRRPLLVWTNLGLAALLLPLLAVDSPGTLWVLFAVLLTYGAAGVVHDAAEAALVATAVDGQLLGDFNGLRMTAAEGMKLIAPLAGAGLYAAYGGARVALLDAVTFVLAAGLYTLLRVHEPPPRPAEGAAGWRARTAEGARYLWGHAVLRPLVLAGGTTMLFAGVNGATVYAVAEGLGHSPAYVGVLYVAQGAGSVVIGLVSGPLLRRLGERRFARYGIALTAVAVAARALPYDAVALASAVAVGVGLPCVLVAALTAVQRETPDALLGRTAATAGTLLFAPNAVGLALGAALVELVPYQPLLVALGLTRLITVLPCRGWPRSSPRP
ncbi:MFS transporter [Streptomyces sp. LRE541]|uniref:MFS transporter n=1 Tax=Streptomyces sp. LRE541 TaxID=2931983 RepID=UPI00200DF2E6|nr:MFS transporter [Streptomyces sp. LRE541]UPZ31984.1 MFS transporter [Streptomyces sp. LRE541]